MIVLLKNDSEKDQKRRRKSKYIIILVFVLFRYYCIDNMSISSFFNTIIKQISLKYIDIVGAFTANLCQTCLCTFPLSTIAAGPFLLCAEFFLQCMDYDDANATTMHNKSWLMHAAKTRFASHLAH